MMTSLIARYVSPGTPCRDIFTVPVSLLDFAEVDIVIRMT